MEESAMITFLIALFLSCVFLLSGLTNSTEVSDPLPPASPTSAQAVAAAVAAGLNSYEPSPDSAFGFFSNESMLTLVTLTDWDAQCEQQFSSSHLITARLLKQHPVVSSEMATRISMQITINAKNLSTCILKNPTVKKSQSITRDIKKHRHIDVAYYLMSAFNTIDYIWANDTAAFYSKDDFNLIRTFKSALLLELLRPDNPPSVPVSMLLISGFQRMAPLLVSRQEQWNKLIADHRRRTTSNPMF